ncbi:hypothetical protein PF005_g20949 [Phytophthora fragariae]|uniref:PDZ domain-containing protein n=1 Tax=Phytophthora fragariae TaxID=53985 RepID=A0A6A3E2D7_9STRA|nr:hypothetical protein PF003_g30500 [Phytophthora fragariae]KAE8928012.1 hypothetical protein PF009_g21830 [Phytophthora fragariae]KAE8987966.1 hypothetical protein PF011_g19358 [Phytophthora fragariae]KAE9086065.1 hypothetical protein PF007_g20908 [Phytophthora fragariae]KAE9086447.1 hypothetical protein PF010_g20080 [Phytophthora fragariae]
MERTSSSDKLMASQCDTSTASLSSSSTASSSSGEGGAPAARPKAGLVATYFLRTAMDWRSSRVDTLEPKAARRNKEQIAQEYAGDSGDNNEGEQEDPLEVEAEPDAAPVDDQIPALEEIEEKEETVQKEKKQFEVTYECLPDVDAATESEEDAVGGMARRPMQYLDVLLQTDERGVGLNVGLGRLEEGEEDGGWVLIVQSFRRVNGKDVGPAEACGKIRVGDILHAVDGEEVCSLQQLHAKLQGRLGKRRKFVLLRFLRPLPPGKDPEASPTSLLGRRHLSIDSVKANWSEIEHLLHSNPQVALLVRRLATTNQLLQDQLVSSKLKQEEQNIQLDQLHALYARTQAEDLPLFSLSKSIRPFSRKSSSSRFSDASADKPIPTKIQTEVIEAVDAEYSRLRQEFQLQHLLDKRELEKKYAEKAQRLEEATAKKVEMLEAGFQQALERFVRDRQCSCHCQAAATTNSTDQNDDILLSKCKQTNSGAGAPNSAKFVESLKVKEDPTLWQIQCLLAEYDEHRRMRTARLMTINPT